jgi:steroid delta-isomerase-like uncharacterized protein
MKTSHLNFVGVIPLAAVLLYPLGCRDQTERTELDKFKAMARVQDRNKGVVREVFAAIDSGKFDRLEELLSDDFALKAPGLSQPWKKGDLFQAIKTHYASFPDWTHVIEVLVAEGDNVAVKLTGQGTQKARYEGIASTGKKVTDPAMNLITIVNGKVKEWWALEDNLGFMQQLGMELRPIRSKK